MKLTPLEKAKELMQNVYDLDEFNKTPQRRCKQMALLCVDEIEAIQFEMYGQDKEFTMYFLEVREQLQAI
jgi:hypothetical protein